MLRETDYTYWPWNEKEIIFFSMYELFSIYLIFSFAFKNVDIIQIGPIVIIFFLILKFYNFICQINKKLMSFVLQH